MYTIAYDVERRRPACVLIQRALGASVPTETLARMNEWVVGDIEGMQLYKIKTTQEEEALVAITNGGNYAGVRSPQPAPAP